ncbi:DUF3524 domain-containing protein [candidate division GN15 bacterium]|nr:DUF3524 domain-containing protein [candidate division GN15 bacterium]
MGDFVTIDTATGPVSARKNRVLTELSSTKQNIMTRKKLTNHTDRASLALRNSTEVFVRVLALEPFYGGSHKAFLDGWRAHSRHEFTVLGLSAHHWKWRMRHSAVTFSHLVDERVSSGGSWDVVFASDMLNLAEFRGLVQPSLRNLPTVLYFHENQLTYPSRTQDDRDLHLAYVNFTSAVAADAIWFNSKFHRREFLEQYGQWLLQMPDHPHVDRLQSIERRASVRYPGIEPVGVAKGERNPEPVLIWPARWEHDKNPELLAIAVQTLAEKSVPFRLRLLGKVFQTRPPALESLGERIGDRLIAAPPPESREDYLRELQRGDIVISTADHEFFGLAVLEALSAGCYPALPNRLAYPELIEHLAAAQSEAYLYDGTRRGLVERLTLLIQRAAAGQLWQNGVNLAPRVDEEFGWEVRAQELDQALEVVAY